jgi:hypothetical protein
MRGWLAVPLINPVRQEVFPIWGSAPAYGCRRSGPASERPHDIGARAKKKQDTLQIGHPVFCKLAYWYKFKNVNQESGKFISYRGLVSIDNSW